MFGSKLRHGRNDINIVFGSTGDRNEMVFGVLNTKVVLLYLVQRWDRNEAVFGLLNTNKALFGSKGDTLECLAF